MGTSPAAVVLDFDGTLCHTRPTIAATLAKTLERELGLEPTLERINRAVSTGGTLDETILALAGRVSSTQLKHLKTKYRALYAQDAAGAGLFPGVPEFLARLRDLGIPSVIVSNKGTPAIRAALNRHRLEEMVLSVTGDTPGTPKKPDPGLYGAAVAPSFPGVPVSEVLMLGDTATDIDFARAVGMRVAWAAYGYGDPTSCAAKHPDLIVSESQDLSAIVTGIP